MNSQQTSDNVWIGIAGHFGSGKTEFNRRLSESEVVSIESLTLNNELAEVIYHRSFNHRSIAFDFGRIAFDENRYLYLIGEPGGLPGGSILTIDLPNLLGVVMMVNSTLPEWFHIARSFISRFDIYCPVPFIVACNKQDRDTAWSPEDLRIVLRVPAHIPVVPCVAKDKESVKQVMLILLEHIQHTLNVE